LVGALAAPSAADAQQAKTVPRIGFIEAGALSANRHFLDAFRQGLRELGYADGRNILPLRTAGLTAAVSGSRPCSTS